LGTASVLVFIKDKGIVLHEPSVVAIDKENNNKIFAVGEEARKMLGRTPGNIVAVRPLREGVIADYDTTEKMLRYFLEKSIGGRKFFKPRVMVCIPSGVTSVEERAVREAALQAGARQAFLIEEPLAAALGAGLDISEANGSMVVDIGGGTCDIAVLSLGGIVCSSSLRVGGDKFDEDIVKYIRRKYNLMIGERTAEEIKIEIGTAYVKEDREWKSMPVRGRDLVSGLPKTIEISEKETCEAMEESLEGIVTSVKEVLEKTPPELTADVIDKGIVLTGGGSMLSGLTNLLSDETGLFIHRAEDPISSVAMGTGIALQMLDKLQENGLVTRKV
jgi:rod shape-determining protein MreB